MKNSKEKHNGMPNSHLHDLFINELKYMLSGEKQLVEALEEMSEVAKNKDLKEAFKNHKEESEGHVDKLKLVFKSIDTQEEEEKCKSIESLIQEGKAMVKDFKDDEALDAALIAAAQKIEHYEIASYGSLVTYAELMNHDKAKEILKEILSEEKEADEKLTDIAMSHVNKLEE